MDFNITNQEKIEMAENAINLLEKNLYSTVVSAGYDPESFVAGVVSDDNSPEINSLYQQVNAINTKINNIKDLIEKLS